MSTTTRPPVAAGKTSELKPGDVEQVLDPLAVKPSETADVSKVGVEGDQPVVSITPGTVITETQTVEKVIAIPKSTEHSPLADAAAEQLAKEAAKKDKEERAQLIKDVAREAVAEYKKEEQNKAAQASAEKSVSKGAVSDAFAYDDVDEIAVQIGPRVKVENNEVVVLEAAKVQVVTKAWIEGLQRDSAGKVLQFKVQPLGYPVYTKSKDTKFPGGKRDDFTVREFSDQSKLTDLFFLEKYKLKLAE